MDIFLSIIAWVGCWSAMMVNAPEYLLINAINQSGEGKLSYFFIKLMKRSYNLIFLIFLNLFFYNSIFCAEPRFKIRFICDKYNIFHKYFLGYYNK